MRSKGASQKGLQSDTPTGTRFPRALSVSPLSSLSVSLLSLSSSVSLPISPLSLSRQINWTELISCIVNMPEGTSWSIARWCAAPKWSAACSRQHQEWSRSRSRCRRRVDPEGAAGGGVSQAAISCVTWLYVYNNTMKLGSELCKCSKWSL